MHFLTRDFQFEASHFLTKYHGKCEKLHGHSYRMRVTVEGTIAENGLILDFAILKRIIKRKVVDRLDHSHLNDLIENPSAERVVLWICQQLHDFPALLLEELADPNLTEEIKNYVRPEDRSHVKPDGAPVRLYEIQLWETPDSSVIIRT